MTCRQLLTAVTVCLIMLSLGDVSFCYGQDAHGVVRKTAADANPTLAITGYTGPENVREILRRTLTKSDWFDLTDKPATAAYTLQAAYNPGIIQLRAQTGGRVVAEVNQTGDAANPTWLVFQAVDKLIAAVFNNPGLCASRIAFALGQNGRKEVFSCNFDGTEARQLTRNGSISTEPAWGPGGQSMVYTLYSRSQTAIVQVDPIQQRQRPIAAFPGLNSGADLSPDRQAIALSLSRDRQVDLYRMDIASRKLLRLTNDSSVESSPAWSPDGRQICFVSDRAGKPQVYLISAGGGSPTRLVNDSSECVSPDWSAVSNQICLSTREAGQYHIAVVELNAGSRTRRIVTTGAGDWESPSWAPDGRHVVCTHQVGRQRELCMVDTRSGRVMRISKPGILSLPSWSELTAR